MAAKFIVLTTYKTTDEYVLIKIKHIRKMVGHEIYLKDGYWYQVK